LTFEATARKLLLSFCLVIFLSNSRIFVASFSPHFTLRTLPPFCIYPLAVSLLPFMLTPPDLPPFPLCRYLPTSNGEFSPQVGRQCEMQSPLVIPLLYAWRRTVFPFPRLSLAAFPPRPLFYPIGSFPLIDPPDMLCQIVDHMADPSYKLVATSVVLPFPRS